MQRSFWLVSTSPGVLGIRTNPGRHVHVMPSSAVVMEGAVMEPNGVVSSTSPRLSQGTASTSTLLSLMDKICCMLAVTARPRRAGLVGVLPCAGSTLSLRVACANSASTAALHTCTAMEPLPRGRRNTPYTSPPAGGIGVAMFVTDWYAAAKPGAELSRPNMA